MTTHQTHPQTRITQASVPITLKYTDPESGKVDVMELAFYPLEDVDYSEMDEWVRAHIIRTARASLNVDSPQHERDETLRTAMVTAMQITAFSGIGYRILATPDGWARLCWQSCKRGRDLNVFTVLMLRKYMFNPTNIAELNDAFKRQNMPSGNGAAKPGNEKLEQAREEPQTRKEMDQRNRRNFLGRNG